MDNTAKQIRVAQLIARLNVGGPAIHTILLTKLLNQVRFHSTLIAGQVSPSEGDMLYLAEKHGVFPQVIPELGREIHWRNDLIAWWKIFRVLRKIRPAIVHTHTAKAGMLGRLAAKIAGVPIIIHTFHGHVFHSYFSRRKTQTFLTIERFLAKFSDAIITVSPKQREEILAYCIGHPEKVHAIGLGLDLQQFVHCDVRRGRLRQELGVDADSPLIGIVARLVPIKGLTYFLEAAKSVVHISPKSQFVIAGDGELRQELEEYAETLGIRSYIHFLGFRQDLPEIYADLDLVVLSSLNEGLPGALIEAMAAAKPVVATQVGGVEDLVQHEHSGILVSAKNSRALADSILHVLALSEQDRISMGQAGQASVYPKYHISTLLKNIEVLYGSLLKSKGIL